MVVNNLLKDYASKKRHCRKSTNDYGAHLETDVLTTNANHSATDHNTTYNSMARKRESPNIERSIYALGIFGDSTLNYVAHHTP